MNKARLGTGALVLVAAAAAGACGSARPGAAKAPAGGVAVGASGSTAACSAPSNAAPIHTTGASSTLALARVDGRRVAYVADEDAKAIVTFDFEARAPIAETPLDGTPAHVYVTKDGRVLATLRDRSELVVLASRAADAPLARACAARTAAEPIAMALTPDERTVLVTSGWGRAVTAFDAASFASRFQVDVPREPRSVVISDDGKTAFVSHAVGSQLSVIDLANAKHAVRTVSMRGWEPGAKKMLERRKKMAAELAAKNPNLGRPMLEQIESDMKQLTNGHPSCQGFALAKSTAVPGRVFAPQVMVDPGDLERRPDGYGDENRETESPSIAVVDEGSGEPFAASLTLGQELTMFKRGRDRRDPRPECLLPRAATVDPSSGSLLVTCYGIDAVVAYDARSANPLTSERRRWTVGAGPSGIVVDTEKHRAVVWSQFDRTLSTFPIGGPELVDDRVTPAAITRTALPPLANKLPAEYALGRILFHAAGDMRISADGRACASCHPDGRDDAITWATPEGPRRSIMLAGRVSRTPPYSWNGNERSIHNHLGNTFDRLSGKGLRSIELDAVVTYISQMPAPPQPEPADRAKVDRGKQIFASSEAGCASCHAGAAFTDGRNHDVGSQHKADRGAAFNTPSLHLVGGTGPYFHDGRYATLAELLRKSDGKMGKTRHLSGDDLDALEAYLRTL